MPNVQSLMYKFKMPWLAGLVMLGLLSACVQDIRLYIPRYADKASISVSKKTIKTVNRAFYASFVAGNWYYRGAKVSHNGINAYIQIPEKLNMRLEIQEKYLREAICPKAEKIELWNQLKHTKLSVHIYTSSQSQSVSAKCNNPWLESEPGNRDLYVRN